MASPTADSLLELERKLEADILDCLRLLERGRKEALQELRATIEEVGISGSTALTQFRARADASLAHVEAVQRELGALNLAMSEFVLTDALDIENLAAFDSWRDRVLGALYESRRAIAALGDADAQTWNASLAPVWDQFRLRLEVVRIHLESDEAEAAEEFAALREQLKKLRAELASDPSKAREQLHHLSRGTEASADWRRLDGWLKALLMWRERGQQ